MKSYLLARLALIGIFALGTLWLGLWVADKLTVTFP